jgi:hypothetical protein
MHIFESINAKSALMRNIAYPLLMLVVLSASSCSKQGESTTPTPTPNPAPAAGPWDGTYKMMSVYTNFADTTDYIPYGGNERRIYAGVRGDTATAGTIVITKEKIAQNGILIYRTEMIQQSTFYKNTNQTVSSSNTTSGQVSPNASNLQSTYTISGSDSVSITDPSILPFPFGSYSTSYPKFRYTFDGTHLTIYNDYYTKKKITSGVDSYDQKTRNQSIAVYKKQ